MSENFEDIIKRLRQCRQQINSSSGATGHLKTLEKIVFKAEKSLRRIHDPNARSALANTVGAKRKLRLNNLRRFIEKNRRLECSIRQGQSDRPSGESAEAAETAASFCSPTNSETAQSHSIAPEDHAPKLVKAIKGRKTEFLISDIGATDLLSEAKSKFESTVGTGTIHRNEHKNALHVRNKWASMYGIEVKDLTKHKFRESIDAAEDSGRISPQKAESLRKIIIREQQLHRDLNETSESLGEQATEMVMKARNEEPLLSQEAKTGSGMLDRASLGRKPPRITIYEAKGGNSRLGYRIINEIKYQQGTTTYLNELTRLDDRYIEGIRKYVMSVSDDDLISCAIRNGTIEVRYELVEAKPDGRIYVTPFILDETILNLPKLDKIL
ncbi:hypothetical protein [Actinomyces oris]|uniref:hypothetical protein n=1 Tax=Actinomyces oris TaxID=544580 RepID=UPI000A7C2DB0|nr:hypothetical protein [Actinomyces oris]